MDCHPRPFPWNPLPCFSGCCAGALGKEGKTWILGEALGVLVGASWSVFSRWTHVGVGALLGLSQVVSQAWQDLKCFSLNLGFPEQEPEEARAACPVPGAQASSSGTLPPALTQQLRKLRSKSSGVAKTTQPVLGSVDSVLCEELRPGFFTSLLFSARVG